MTERDILLLTVGAVALAAGFYLGARHSSKAAAAAQAAAQPLDAMDWLLQQKGPWG